MASRKTTHTSQLPELMTLFLLLPSFMQTRSKLYVSSAVNNKSSTEHCAGVGQDTIHTLHWVNICTLPFCLCVTKIAQSPDLTFYLFDYT